MNELIGRGPDEKVETTPKNEDQEGDQQPQSRVENGIPILVIGDYQIQIG